jgi:hypothetical protein
MVSIWLVYARSKLISTNMFIVNIIKLLMLRISVWTYAEHMRSIYGRLIRKHLAIYLTTININIASIA